jgi:hypothetical protein
MCKAQMRTYLLVLVPGNVRLRAVDYGEVAILPVLTLRHDLVAVLQAKASTIRQSQSLSPEHSHCGTHRVLFAPR